MCLRGAAGNRESLGVRPGESGPRQRGPWALRSPIAGRPALLPPPAPPARFRRGGATPPGPRPPSPPPPWLPRLSRRSGSAGGWFSGCVPVFWRRSLLPPSRPGPRSACPLPGARGHLSQPSALSSDRRRPPLHCPSAPPVRADLAFAPPSPGSAQTGV